MCDNGRNAGVKKQRLEKGSKGIAASSSENNWVFSGEVRARKKKAA